MNRSVGRPAKGRLKRNRKVTVAFNNDEYRMVRSKAKDAHVTTACWCRATALNRRMRAALSDEDRNLLKNMYKLGVNINQMLRLMQNRSVLAFNSELKAMLREFGKINQYFREVIRNGSKDS